MFRRLFDFIFKHNPPLTRCEVADLIERMTRGEDRGWEWDNFIYAKFDDPEIIAARTEMDELYSSRAIGVDATEETKALMMRCAERLRQSEIAQQKLGQRSVGT